MGLLAGIISLIHLPSSVFFFMIWITLSTFRAFQWREWVVPLFGFVFPWMLVCTWYFWQDGLSNLFTQIIPQTLDVTMSLPTKAYLPYAIALGVFALPALWGHLISSSAEVLRVGKSMMIMSWIVMLTAIMFLITARDTSTFYFLALPLSVMFANRFLSLNRVWIAEIAFIILLVLQCYGHFAKLFNILV